MYSPMLVFCLSSIGNRRKGSDDEEAERGLREGYGSRPAIEPTVGNCHAGNYSKLCTVLILTKSFVRSLAAVIIRLLFNRNVRTFDKNLITVEEDADRPREKTSV